MIGFAGLECTYLLAAFCGAVGLCGITFITAVQEKSSNLSGHFLKSFFGGLSLRQKT
jgi:hypothetical protein